MNLLEVRQQLILGVPLTKLNLRVTDYSRVSTDHKTQLSSLKNQIDHFDKMINDNENWTYIKGYVDEGITGTSDIKRENFMRMIEDAKNNKFDLIITKEISRFSRNTLDSIKYTRELLSYGVAVLFVNDNINTALPDSELRLTIMASLAQDEIRRLSERVKFGMNESINRGNILGHNKLYGYKKDKITNKLVIIPKEAKIVKRLFNMYVINNKSLNEIAKVFNQEKIPTNRNCLWSATTLSRMIKNIKYKGYYCGKKTEVIDYITKKVKYIPESDWIIYKDPKIPPIISESLWDKANTRLKSKKTKKRQSQNKYLYTSKLICKTHNKPFYRRKQNNITWFCSEYLNKGKAYCDTPNLKENDLNQVLKEIFKKINLEPIKKILLDIYKKLNTQKINQNFYQKIEEKVTIPNIFPILVNKLISKIIISKDKIILLDIYLNYNIHLVPNQIITISRNNSKELIKFQIITHTN